MKRIEEVYAEVRAAGLKKSDRQIFRYLRQAGITPAGPRQCPQLWPDDAAQRILSSRGIVTVNEFAGIPTRRPVAVRTIGEPRLVSLATLQAVKRKARR